mmetsp:Transcript_14005/g.34187  ORF Transcript_14005/g.34187 Transcript_14005/m.34187 type:complete len:217 (-) Transcript_14005:109-759(-)
MFEDSSDCSVAKVQSSDPRALRCRVPFDIRDCTATHKSSTMPFVGTRTPFRFIRANPHAMLHTSWVSPCCRCRFPVSSKNACSTGGARESLPYATMTLANSFESSRSRTKTNRDPSVSISFSVTIFESKEVIAHKQFPIICGDKEVAHLSTSSRRMACVSDLRPVPRVASLHRRFETDRGFNSLLCSRMNVSTCSTKSGLGIHFSFAIPHNTFETS